MEYSDSVHAGTRFSEALVLFVASQIPALGVIVFILFPSTGLTLWPVPVVLWIASAFCAYRHITPKPPRPDDIMVRPGYPVRQGTAWAYSFLIASIPCDVLAALMVEIGIAWGSSIRSVAPVGAFLHVVTLLFLIFAVTSWWKARDCYLEVATSMPVYASPVQYSILKAAQKGLVILGHELQHAADIDVSSPSTSPESLPGELKSRSIETWVGEDRPFCLDLEKQRNPHVVVFGSAGTGKSETVRALALRCWVARHIPFLVIDRTGEYASFVNAIGGVVWSVPESFAMNLLRLGGYSPHQRATEIEESLTYTVELSPLQAAEVSRAVLETYNEAGIDEKDESTWTRTPPTWNDVINLMEAKARSGKYSGQQLESVGWAIRKLHRMSRVFGEERHEFFDIVLKVPVCLDMSGLRGAEISKSMLTYSLLQRLYNHFEVRGFSSLSLLVIIDEAHLVLKTEQKSAAITQEPLLIRIVRLARKYGFGIVIATQLASDIPEPVIANAATIIALMFDEPGQVNYIRKFLNLSKHELEAFSRLPPGACFVKRLGNRYPSLVKVQKVSQEEIQAAKTLTERVCLPKPVNPEQKLRTASYASDASPPSERQIRDETAKLTSRDTGRVTPTAFSNKALRQAVESNELTLSEKRVLRLLETGPVPMTRVLDAFPDVNYRRMLRLLEGLQTQGLVQEAKVANLDGKGTVFYCALRAEWLQSESIEHRAMVNMIAQALGHLRPIHYTQTRANAPDLGLELTQPRGCIEVETSRKKFTPSELERWAAGVKERNGRLGYRDTLVVVPNSDIEARYKQPCEKYGLELVTIGRLGAELAATRKQEDEGGPSE